HGPRAAAWSDDPFHPWCMSRPAPCRGVARARRVRPSRNWDWNVDPVGLRVALRRLTSRYRLPLLITENRLGEFDELTEDLQVNDDYRIRYLKSHLEECKVAIGEGVPLIGFCPWS